MILIGFGNKARHGKDTAAEALVDHYKRAAAQLQYYYGPGATPSAANPIAKVFRFAEALYEECRRDHGMTEKDAPLLQKVGTARRAENPNYWIDQVFKKIDADPQMKSGIAIISDTRYFNEADEIKKRGGHIINVSRLNIDGSPFRADDRPWNHPSEIELDAYNWDFRIVAHSGESALVGELAITIVEYIRAHS